MDYLDASMTFYPGFFQKMPDRVFSLFSTKTMKFQVVLNGKLPLMELSYGGSSVT